MKKNKLSIIFAILICICIFSVAAIADRCSYEALPTEEVDIEEAEEEYVQQPEKEVEEQESAQEEEQKETPAIESAVYDEQEIEYFFETALGTEFGTSQPIIHKWTDNIRIKINGTPTGTDLDSLGQVIAELNSLIGSITFDIVTRNSNIDIYFTAVDQFASIEPGYVPGNMGFFWVWWDNTGAIYKGKVLIAIDGISQQERSHLIREELTQSLGIMNDSYRYKDSIFYQEWTDTINYAPIDRTIISLLYDPRLKPGMTQDQVRNVLDIH